ncbi:hypothetical protein OC842_005840 [Tilletia horrida]|uniref:Uncharacterized protein n=1 Tax=Tilletia horrida TaxID=155126 RepID=A0AAN6GBI3_9BASI|nr:hypothetical protein OC842_005840 [Tilletia horrida]
MDLQSAPPVSAIVELLKLAGEMVQSAPHYRSRYDTAYKRLMAGETLAPESLPVYSAAPSTNTLIAAPGYLPGVWASSLCQQQHDLASEVRPRCSSTSSSPGDGTTAAGQQSVLGACAHTALHDHAGGYEDLVEHRIPAALAIDYQHRPGIGQPSEPSQFSQPSEPSQFSQPSQPSEPSQFSQPSEPSQFSQPSQPSQPSQFSQPSQPSQFSQPSEPSEPSEPIQPSQFSQFNHQPTVRREARMNSASDGNYQLCAQRAPDHWRTASHSACNTDVLHNYFQHDQQHATLQAARMTHASHHDPQNNQLPTAFYNFEGQQSTVSFSPAHETQQGFTFEGDSSIQPANSNAYAGCHAQLGSAHHLPSSCLPGLSSNGTGPYSSNPAASLGISTQYHHMDADGSISNETSATSNAVGDRVSDIVARQSQKQHFITHTQGPQQPFPSTLTSKSEVDTSPTSRAVHRRPSTFSILSLNLGLPWFVFGPHPVPTGDRLRLLRMMKADIASKFIHVLQPRSDQIRQAQQPVTHALSKCVTDVLRKQFGTAIHISRLCRALNNAARRDSVVAKSLEDYMSIIGGKPVIKACAYEIINAVSRHVFLGIVLDGQPTADSMTVAAAVVDSHADASPSGPVRNSGPVIYLADVDRPFFMFTQDHLCPSRTWDKKTLQKLFDVSQHPITIQLVDGVAVVATSHA